MAILVAEQNSAVALAYAHRAVVLENGVSAHEEDGGVAARARRHEGFLSRPRDPGGVISQPIEGGVHERTGQTAKAGSADPAAERASACDPRRRGGDRSRREARRRFRGARRRCATRTANGRCASSIFIRRAASGRSTFPSVRRTGTFLRDDRARDGNHFGGDSSIGQIAQNHIGVVAAIRTVSDEAQQKLLFAEVLKGTRFGNAFSEFGSKRAAEFETRFEDKGDHVVVTGKKFYSTGALLAHLVPIVAVDGEGRAWYAIAERGAEGLTVIDDWSSFGQRTTLSGTVILDHVKVPKTHLVPGYKGYDHPTADGAIFQIIQVAVDSGIAKAAIDETIEFVRTKSRPWIELRQGNGGRGSLHRSRRSARCN